MQLRFPRSKYSVLKIEHRSDQGLQLDLEQFKRMIWKSAIVEYNV